MSVCMCVCMCVCEWMNGKKVNYLCWASMCLYIWMHFKVDIANDEITKCDQRVGSAISHINLQIKSNPNDEKKILHYYNDIQTTLVVVWKKELYFVLFPTFTSFGWSVGCSHLPGEFHLFCVLPNSYNILRATMPLPVTRHTSSSHITNHFRYHEII